MDVFAFILSVTDDACANVRMTCNCVRQSTQPTHTQTGELSKEEDVLEWLIENKSTGDDEEVIEDVTAKTLSTLVGNVDNLVVLFCECFRMTLGMIYFLRLQNLCSNFCNQMIMALTIQ